jgi:hypothetical protein
LEFRDRTAEVVGCKVVGGGVVEVVNEPAMAERGVGDVGYVEFFGGVN